MLLVWGSKESTVKKFYSCIILSLTACQTNVPETINRGKYAISEAAPGTVIHQSVRDLENGFYDVSKSVVNASDHWEGIGHFGYVYFGKIEICQCSEGQTAISPGGHYIVYYSNKKDKLEIYNTQSKQISILSEKYIGYPNRADWNLKAGTANVYLSQPKGADPIAFPITLN